MVVGEAVANGLFASSGVETIPRLGDRKDRQKVFLGLFETPGLDLRQVLFIFPERLSKGLVYRGIQAPDVGYVRYKGDDRFASQRLTPPNALKHTKSFLRWIIVRLLSVVRTS